MTPQANHHPPATPAGSPGLDQQELTGALQSWLGSQRWFGGKGRPLLEVSLESCTQLPAESGVRLLHCVVQAHYSDGDIERYQVPVTVRVAEHHDLAHAAIGLVAGGVLYDAVHDPAGSAGLLELIRTAHQSGGPQQPGDLSATVSGEIVELGAGRLIGAEQSNSSMVYGSSVIVKLFRRLAPGQNPDLEVTRALAAAGCPSVVPPLGWVTGLVAGEHTTLMLAQPFLANAIEGWRLATASVRDLYAEGDLRADEVGGDFASESQRLGVATGEVHRTLAETLPQRQADAAEIAEIAAAMANRLEHAANHVPELRPFALTVGTAFEAFGSRGGKLALQRVHGDFHLGQVLRDADGWVLVDFEGEPATPLSERTALASTYRDIAGMLRSFDYAARSLLSDHSGQAGLAYRAAEWAGRNRAAFCDGYADTTGSDPRDDAVVLRAYELDKAVYEVLYEARNRPSWLSIPLGAIERLAS